MVSLAAALLPGCPVGLLLSWCLLRQVLSLETTQEESVSRQVVREMDNENMGESTSAGESTSGGWGWGWGPLRPSLHLQK